MPKDFLFVAKLWQKFTHPKMYKEATGEEAVSQNSFPALSATYVSNNQGLSSRSASPLSFKKEATVEALIYAPNGGITFDKNATVTGSIVVADIQVDKNASITFNVDILEMDLPGGELHIQKWKIN